MTVWTAVSTIVLSLLASGGLWAYLTARATSRATRLTHKDDNDLRREMSAIEVLSTRIAGMEIELKTVHRDANIYRRVGHDVADIAHSLRLLLVTKFIEINEILIQCGKPERYADPVKAATEAFEEVSKVIVGERQALYDKADRAEQISQLQHAETEVKKEQIVKEAEQTKE